MVKYHNDIASDEEDENYREFEDYSFKESSVDPQ
jgi:hypothetical protein